MGQRDDQTLTPAVAREQRLEVFIFDRAVSSSTPQGSKRCSSGWARRCPTPLAKVPSDAHQPVKSGAALARDSKTYLTAQILPARNAESDLGLAHRGAHSCGHCLCPKRGRGQALLGIGSRRGIATGWLARVG